MSASGSEISGGETLIRNDVVRGSVDFRGRPSVRSKSGRWKSASFILGVEVAERLIYYGVSSNLVTYLTGPLGQSTATAAAAANAWSGTTSLMPLLGAFVADSFLGRYRMVIVSSLLYALGLGFLTISATPFSSSDCRNGRHNRKCSVAEYRIILFYLSLYLVALAQGGHKPCAQAFGADQFDEGDENENKAKNSFFNWWYFATCVSISVGILVLNYVQDNLSWGLCFGISCAIICLALLLFLLGTRTYRYSQKIDEVNPFIRIIRVFINAARNRRAEHEELHVHERGYLKCLDKALLEKGKVCSAGDVEEAKAILRLVPIWFTCLGYGIVFSQTSTLFTKQGATMDRHITSSFQIPAASLLSLISLTIVFFVPIYDRILVPIARSITNKQSGLTMLQRIGTGIFLSFICTVVAAVVEQRRLAAAAEHSLVDLPDATVPMTVWWLVPQYVVFGIADVFTMVGLQEFFYDQVSSELKSIGLALCLSIIGIGGFLSSFLISVIQKTTHQHGSGGWFADNLNRAHLDYFYWLLAGLSAAEFIGFVYFARSYTYCKPWTVGSY